MGGTGTYENFGEITRVLMLVPGVKNQEWQSQTGKPTAFEEIEDFSDDKNDKR